MESKEAIQVSPDYAPAYIMLGKIYSKRKDYPHAFENYRLGALFAQNDEQARLGLAQAYENLKDYEGAFSQYQRLLGISPKSVQGYFGMARCYALECQEKKALNILAEARKLGLEDKVDVQKIHDIINSKKRKLSATLAAGKIIKRK